jgi:hypothetical protein
MTMIGRLKSILEPFPEETFWRVNDEQKKDMLRRCLYEICRHYGVGPVRIDFVESPIGYRYTGGGVYEPGIRITLYKLSLMTFLHEVAHHLAYSGKIPGGERRAVLWSHRVFYSLFPRQYERSREKGLFFHSPDMAEVTSGTF